jgi:hypothetical protein
MNLKCTLLICSCMFACVSPFIASQQLGENVIAATNIDATIEDMLDASFFSAVCVASRKVGE